MLFYSTDKVVFGLKRLTLHYLLKNLSIAMMKKYKYLLVATVFATATYAQAQKPLPELDPESCTSIMVGRQASKDGSVITSHTCDGNYRTWMDIVPATSYARDTTTEITDGRLHTEHPACTRRLVVKGSVPQPAKTFKFLNTAYPCLNEKQLGMGETTITGRKELVNPEGMFRIEELQRLALQRCTTAREAILLMGDLVKQYGYGDWGECLTIADPKEVWHFEVFGEGSDKIGGVWAAVRIPDGHVGVSANVPRIGALDLKDKDNFMASDNVYQVAKDLGLWDGKSPFRFWEAYGGGNYFGEKKNYSVRELFILQALAPSRGFTSDIEELPISVQPDAKVDVTDVMRLLTQTYEGTELDPTRNLKVAVKKRGTETCDTIVSPYANPWMTRDMSGMLNSLAPGSVSGHRLVAVPQCSYSTVIQLRDWLPDAVGGVAWVSFDNPGQSPRIPIFCGVNNLPSSFKLCGQPRYNEKSALWKFRRANKLATVKWGATRKTMESAFNHFVDKGQREIPFVEKTYADILVRDGEAAANDYLTSYTSDFAGAAMLRWEEMADGFWESFARGF